MACTSKSCAISHPHNQRYRKVLWLAFALNISMFVIELLMGMKAQSVSLLSDSLDFLGDSANYLISLLVLPMALHYRAKASLLKGITMGGFGLFVFLTSLYRWQHGNLPNYSEMSLVGVLALLTNLAAAALLYRFREGDSNMRGVWLCSRNDAIGNLAVIVAGGVVYFTQSKYPDLIVAILLSSLAMQAAWVIISQALRELRQSPFIS